MVLGANKMTIHYTDGRTVQGALLFRSDNIVRAVLKGGDDVAEFKCLNGTWASEDCEPVRIEFAWERLSRNEVVSEADCLCSNELASRLIHLLLNGSDEDELAMPSFSQLPELSLGASLGWN
jgi:hypothetical protein